MSHDLAAISSDKEPNIDHYKLLNTTGQGSFAKVRLVHHILMGQRWLSKPFTSRARADS